VVERDPAEVHGHGGGGLALYAGCVIHADAFIGEVLLGKQRLDLANRADECGLADAEPARDQNLQGDGQGVVDAGVRGTEGHRGPP
jgi:hypothetical protein